MSSITGAKYAVATITANQLNGAINSSVTSIVVDATTNFASSGTITIEDEEITYTGLSGGTTFTGCTRGANGTTAASHADNTAVIMGRPYDLYVTTTPFVSGDFGVTRIAALFNSAQTACLGIAYIRGYSATNRLELIAPFYNPSTNARVYVANGDKVFISKNWSESTGTDISMTGKVVTLANTACMVGTTDDPDSVVMYDEYVQIQSTFAGAGHNLTIQGGVFVMGFREPGTGQTYRGVQYFCTANTIGWDFFSYRSDDSYVVMYACQIDANTGGTYVSPYTTAQYNLNGNFDAAMWVFDGCVIGQDVFGRSNYTFTAPEKHRFINCSFNVKDTNAIAVRFGNGVIRGGFFKLKSDGPLSCYGADAAGTYNYGADPSQRMVVTDIGHVNNALWRSNIGTDVQTVNYTNLITTDKRAVTGSGTGDLAAATGCTQKFYFEDNYTNVLTNTNLAVFRNADMTIDESKTASAATVSLKLYHEYWVGKTKNTEYGPWTSRLRLYGYGYFEYAIAQGTYRVDYGADADNVSFGGLVNQLADSAIVLSQANADAVTGVTVTDHGGSPVSWQGKSWGITITGNKTTNPSLTASNIYDHFKSGISKLTSFNSKTGILWHDALSKVSAFYRTSRGLYSGTYKGVRVVDESGNPFPGFDLMTADDGTTYAPPATVTVKVTVKDVDTGSAIETARVLLYASTGSTVTITRSGSTATVSHTAHGYQTGQKVVILGADQGEYNGVKTITYISDNSYSFTVSGTPATPATGTIKSHRCILDGASNSSGVVQDTGFVYTADLAVTGRVRKTTSAPYYKTGSVSGTISSSGFDTTVLLVGDP